MRKAEDEILPEVKERTDKTNLDSSDKLHDKSLRTLPKFSEVVKTNRAYLRNKGGAQAMIAWDLNERAIRDQVFVFRVRDKDGKWIDSYISKQELLHYMRAI